jgi:hypothetical protein
LLSESACSHTGCKPPDLLAGSSFCLFLQAQAVPRCPAQCIIRPCRAVALQWNIVRLH